MDPRTSSAKRRLSQWTNVFPRHAQKVFTYASDQSTQGGLRRRILSFRRDLTRQKFTDQQKKALSAFSSVNYSPTHSISFIRWLGDQKNRFYSRLELDRWFLVVFMGIIIGLIAVFLKQSITALSEIQWHRTKKYLRDGNTAQGFWVAAGINCGYVIVSSFLVTFIHPPAAGGGTPEVIAFLNGIIVHGTLSLKNLIVKFVANVFAVGSGLPAAIQAPVITYGAIVGAGIGQFQSKTLGLKPDIFTRFRNAGDRREFTTAGVAAGVSAGFNAPIGGLLFAMEDISSFWTKTISWQTFFACVIAAIVAQVFNAAFNAFEFKGQFGAFTEATIVPIQMHLGTLVPAVVLGVCGGLLAVLFTRLNTFICDQRKMLVSRIPSVFLQRLARMLETIILVILMTAYAVYLPFGFSCKDIDDSAQNSTLYNNLGKRVFNISRSSCPPVSSNSSIQRHNQMAALIQGGGNTYLSHLWSRGTYYAFDYDVCLAAFTIYFFMTIWTAGSAIAGGIFVPLLVSGSLYGRALGVGMVHIWQAVTGTPNPTGHWSWIDPGITAAIGAASLLGGVNRIATASTVIVMEMVGDISLVIPNLISIFIAKAISNQLSKPLFKCQLESKALPYLEPDPRVLVAGKQLNLELCRASDIMSSPVSTLQSRETVANLAKLLTSTTHGGYPVIKHDSDTKMEVAYGFITRIELYAILCSEDVYKQETPGSVVHPVIPYADLSVDYIADKSAAEERIRTYARFKIYSSIYVDLEPFINISTPKVDKDYSLYRTYVIFRTLGLRHLVVVDVNNRVVGMITRKDLMPFQMQDRLERLLEMTKINSNNNGGGANDYEKSANGTVSYMTSGGDSITTQFGGGDLPSVSSHSRMALDGVVEDIEGEKREHGDTDDDEVDVGGGGGGEGGEDVEADAGSGKDGVGDNGRKGRDQDGKPIELIVRVLPTMDKSGFETPL